MNDKIVLFDEIPKKEKSSFLNGIWKVNQFVKNIFEEAYIDSLGRIYNTESKVIMGRVLIYSNFHEFINIPEGWVLKINTRILYDSINNGKTKLTGYEIFNNEFIMKSVEGDYRIGTFENVVLNLRAIENIMDNINNDVIDITDKIELIDEKKVVTIPFDDTKEVYLCNKTVPNVTSKKCDKLTIQTKDNSDDTFYSITHGLFQERNKKEEVVFSIDIKYFYRHLKL